MQPPFAFPVDEISSRNLTSDVLSTEMRDREGNAHLALYGRNTDSLRFPVERIGMDIVAHSTKVTLRALDRLELWNGLVAFPGFGNLLRIRSLVSLLPGKGALEGFSRLHTGLDQQVRNQARTSCFCVVVGAVVQLHAIFLMLLPAIGTDHIERLRELLECPVQGLRLLWRRMKLYSYGSVHAENIPYMRSFCQMIRF